jgi:hypothetical protein
MLFSVFALFAVVTKMMIRHSNGSLFDFGD